jgi:hypothetical protein
VYGSSAEPLAAAAGGDGAHSGRFQRCGTRFTDRTRRIVCKQADRVVQWSRHGTNFSDKLPKIAAAVRALPADHVMLDGEAVLLRSDG